MKNLILILMLLTSISLNAQKFYINTGLGTSQNDNRTYVLDIDSCPEFTETKNLPIYTCPSSSVFNDIAIDNDSNIWYVAWGGNLYKRKINDTICDSVMAIYGDNALVADSLGNLYSAGSFVNYKGHRSSVFQKFDGTTLSPPDTLPHQMFSSGDLFFYQNRLFLTCYKNVEDSMYIAEININEPKYSCYYMPLPLNTRPFGAFTVRSIVGKERVFILSMHRSKGDSTSMIEVDMKNKRIIDTVCTFPFLVRGAGALYQGQWDSTTCYTPPASVVNSSIPAISIDVLNPSSDYLRLTTNLKSNEIRQIALYNLSGKTVKTYQQQHFPGELDVKDLPNGMYLLRIKISTGELWNRKVVVTH